MSTTSREANQVFPLYIYTDGSQRALGEVEARKPNFDQDVIDQISGSLGLDFASEKNSSQFTFAPIDVFDYIYAILHSPSFREKYKEFLKIDFPRVPYPESAEEFWQLAALGGELREIHLLESPKVNKFITGYPVAGGNLVEKLAYKNANVYINANQYFAGVPETAWNFYIGGYQPAQKWLKDRKGRTLSFDDIQHYQKIIVALTETNRIMKQIDEIRVW
jgi:predicted helicase